jgi:hypothetical protein
MTMKAGNLALVLLVLLWGCGPAAEVVEEPVPGAAAPEEAAEAPAPGEAAGPEEIHVVYASEGVPILPDDAAWEKLPKKTLKLVGQAIIPPHGGGTVQAVDVRAIHDGESLALLLEWVDASIDRAVGSSTFRDAVAVGFPTRESTTLPSPFMGDAQHSVNIWQWTADFDANARGKSGFAERYPHTEGVWYFPQDPAVSRTVRAWRGTEPVIELEASGFGTLERHASQNVYGASHHAQGRWRVVLRRDLSTGSPEDTLFRPGSRSHLTVAVWDGAENNVNGKKSITMNWSPFVLDPTLVAASGENKP